MRKSLLVFSMILFTTAVFAAGDDNWFMAQTKVAPISSVTATSELVEAQYDGKYLYPPINIVDGNFDNTWCEAETNGPGIGEAVTIELSQPVSFDEIQIVNGFVSGKDYYTKNNRIKDIQITQVAKKHFQQKTYTLSDNTPTWQSVKFSQTQTAQTITFKIMSVYKGSKYDDTCLDDVRLLYKGKVIPFTNVEDLKKVQEENSKDMLNSSSEDFQKTFYSLFTKNTNPEATRYLYLLADNKKDVVVFMKAYDEWEGDYYLSVKSGTLVAKTNFNAFKNTFGPYYFSYYINEKDFNSSKASYFACVKDEWNWRKSVSNSLGNHRYITETTIDYVTTTTSTTIKLDGKSIYLNGVHYTILNPDTIEYAYFGEGV